MKLRALLSLLATTLSLSASLSLAASLSASLSSCELAPSSSSTAQHAAALTLDLSQVPQAERNAVIDVVVRIDAGGPFLYRQDDTVFQNRERRLPVHPAGFWREYTVPTPGSSDRGARRVVAGDDDSLFYTRNHYGSFVQIRAADDDDDTATGTGSDGNTSDAGVVARP